MGESSDVPKEDIPLEGIVKDFHSHNKPTPMSTFHLCDDNNIYYIIGDNLPHLRPGQRIHGHVTLREGENRGYVESMEIFEGYDLIESYEPQCPKKLYDQITITH